MEHGIVKRGNRKLWQIVPPTVRHKVARLWPDKLAAANYLQELVSRTLHSRQDLMAAAARVEGSPIWAAPRLEADMDLARVYAIAAWCVLHTDTYAAFEDVLNRVSVRQLSAMLTAPVPWTEVDLRRAGHHILHTS